MMQCNIPQIYLKYYDSLLGEFLSCLGFRGILQIKLGLGKIVKNSLDLFRKWVLLK